MSDGIGCKCAAWNEYECSCSDVDWRSAREVELEDENEALRKDAVASAESSPITEEVEDILRSEIAKRDAQIAELIKECERFRQEALCAYLDNEESIIAKQALRIEELEQARGICPKCACASDFTLTSPR